ncbi:MAG: RsmG family class I SAM-dependent methyltransferase [Acidobacteriota bacterium]
METEHRPLSIGDPRVLSYLDLLMRWNRRVSLVSKRMDRRQIVSDLLSPILEAVQAMGPMNGAFLDVGAGSGMGGVMFALANPDLHVTFVERVFKKAAFIKQACAELGLAGRIDVEPRDLREIDWKGRTYRYVFIRAVGDVAVGAHRDAPLIRHARDMLAPGAELLVIGRPGAQRATPLPCRTLPVGRDLVLRVMAAT